MRHWRQVAVVGVGWYLAQSYSRYPDVTAVNLVAICVVTVGVALVGIACYHVGLDRGREER